MKSKNGWNCFMFATNVENSNKEELFKVVLEYGDKGCINAFLKNIDFDKDKFKIYLLFI